MEAQVEELKRTLAQVHNDSREIEKELESELLMKDQECNTLRSRLDQAVAEVQQWKAKFETSQDKIRSIEIENDDHKDQIRIFEATIFKLENENQQLLEKLALSSLDTTHSQEVEVELQRNKQSLVDAEDEIIKLEAKIAALTRKKPSINRGTTMRRDSKPVGININQKTELRSREWLTNGILLPKENNVSPFAPPMVGRGHGTTAIQR